ncbi:MAG: hypothetical protein HRT82_12975 [Henriciella sp.]|nr:hypothetical protein [Henriciella sp.]
MTVYWPDNAKDAFGHEILRADHQFEDSELFSDDGLAHLLDLYPRSALDIWTFESRHQGGTLAQKGRAPRMSGKDIVDAVKHGHIWLSLPCANHELEDLKPVADELYGSLETATGRRPMKREMNLLISSPNVEVGYHLDIPMVALFQVRGRKRLWLYPPEEEFAPAEHVEHLVHITREEDLPYQASFDEKARVFELAPGMGVTWPQLSPHRVRNAKCVNVSLSCEFMTTASLVNANAIYTNAFLRQNLNLSPKAQNGIGPAALGKAAFASLHKAMQPRDRGIAHTPITFELDPSIETCVKPLWA